MSRKKDLNTPMIRTLDGSGEWYQSQRDYNAKYNRDVVEGIYFRVPKGWRDKIHECAIKSGDRSVNSMLLRLVQNEMRHIGID